MRILESFTTSKRGRTDDNEDVLFVSDHFVAIFDGATDKSGRSYGGMTGGRLAALSLAAAMKGLPPGAGCDAWVDLLTESLSMALAPLAPYMLAALVATGTEGELRRSLEDVLGLSAGEARAEVSRLLSEGPAALRSAVALWRRSTLNDQGAFGVWERGVPAQAATGPIPSQVKADEWTAAHTGGLVKKFPVPITDQTVCLLAAAIAAKIQRDEPLADSPAPDNHWGLKQMLCPEPTGVFKTSAGLVAVAESSSAADHISVFSFIADLSVTRGGLVLAALALIESWYAADGKKSPIEAVDLPEHGHAWEAIEGSRSWAVSPAFKEEADAMDILPITGVEQASAGFANLVDEALPLDLPPGVRPLDLSAKMSAVAHYDRYGFEAAAVAVMGMAGAAMFHPFKVLKISFDRPHLVLAVSDDPRYHGLPLFAVWVDKGVCEPEPQDSSATERRR